MGFVDAGGRASSSPNIPIWKARWWCAGFSVSTVQRNAQWLRVVEVLWVKAWLAALTELFLRLLCWKLIKFG